MQPIIHMSEVDTMNLPTKIKKTTMVTITGIMITEIKASMIEIIVKREEIMKHITHAMIIIEVEE